MRRTWCAFAGLCMGVLMLDNSFRLAPLDTSLMEGGKGKRNSGALSGTTSPFRGSCRLRRGEPTSENHDSFCPAPSFGCGSSPESATKENEECRCILLGTTSSLRSSCHCCAMGRTEGSYPTKAPRKRGMQMHYFRDYFAHSGLVPPSAGRTEGSYPAKVPRKRGMQKHYFRDYFAPSGLVPLLRNGANRGFLSHKSTKKKRNAEAFLFFLVHFQGLEPWAH